MGWNEDQKLFQLKAHLEKTAEHTIWMLPEREKSGYTDAVAALRKRYRSLDIEELRGLKFHQLMQDKQSVEALGIELQKRGRKAFPTSDPKEFDRILKGRFYQALLPKWQQKLGAPKTMDTFEELYARAQILERHNQQYNANRGEAKQNKSKSTGVLTFYERPKNPTSKDKHQKKQGVKESVSHPLGRSAGCRGCFNCGDIGHIQRNCPKLKSEAAGSSGNVSTLSETGPGGDASGGPEQSLRHGYSSAGLCPGWHQG